MRENISAIRLGDSEWNQIFDMAYTARLPMSTYVRAFILNAKPPKPKTASISLEAVAALNRANALLSQIALVRKSDGFGKLIF